MSLDKLIIFDYSGTLSLEAPLFAGPDTLMKHIAETGLRDFGIDSPRVFWEQLVNPTWKAGSTTATGYQKVLAERIVTVLQPDLPLTQRARLADAVESFVQRYLNHSRIDPSWKPLLTRIQAHPSVKAVIATDHYAEATDAIIKFLGEWRIHALKPSEAARDSRASRFIVANSADLGVHKADPRFWQILKTGLCLDDIGRILIIDDFGYNEQYADDYSDRLKVETRMNQTVKILEVAFSATVEVFPVLIGTHPAGRDAWIEKLIGEASAAVERHLISGRVSR